MIEFLSLSNSFWQTCQTIDVRTDNIRVHVNPIHGKLHKVTLIFFVTLVAQYQSNDTTHGHTYCHFIILSSSKASKQQDIMLLPNKLPTYSSHVHTLDPTRSQILATTKPRPRSHHSTMALARLLQCSCQRRRCTLLIRSHLDHNIYTRSNTRAVQSVLTIP